MFKIKTDQPAFNRAYVAEETKLIGILTSMGVIFDEYELYVRLVALQQLLY